MAFMRAAAQKPVDERLAILVEPLRFLYYAYLTHYHVRAVTMMDLVDGMLFVEAKTLLLEEQREDGRQARNRKR